MSEKKAKDIIGEDPFERMMKSAGESAKKLMGTANQLQADKHHNVNFAVKESYGGVEFSVNGVNPDKVLDGRDYFKRRLKKELEL